MHNAPKIYYTVLSQSFQQLSGISRIAYPGERSPFPSWNKNGIDAVNHRSCRTSYIFFPPKEPTEFANTSNEISKKEEGREKRNSRSRNIDIRNPRKQKHSGTCTGFTSFSFLYSEERQTFRNIYPVALHSIENLVSLFCNRSPRYVIARAPSKQPRSQGSIKCVHSHDLHSEYGIAGTAHRLVRVAFNRDGWLLPCGQRQIIPPALKFILYLLLAFVLSNRACVCARILGRGLSEMILNVYRSISKLSLSSARDHISSDRLAVNDLAQCCPSSNDDIVILHYYHAPWLTVSRGNTRSPSLLSFHATFTFTWSKSRVNRPERGKGREENGKEIRSWTRGNFRKTRCILRCRVAVETRRE